MDLRRASGSIGAHARNATIAPAGHANTGAVAMGKRG